MINPCDIVQDLLPLYVDGACSESSCAMVKAHLETCPECKAFYEKLCSDTGEGMLKAEMTEVVAKHEKQSKRKRAITISTSVMITAGVAFLIICLLAWRIWPNAFPDIITISEKEITGFSSNATIHFLEEGQPYSDSYSIDTPDAAGNEAGEILEILATSSYQQDFRNLLLWSVDYVEADTNYDGRSVTLAFSTGNHKDEWVQIHFLSSTTMVVSTGGEKGLRIYHPTNQKTFDDLMDYFEEYGEKR